MNPTTPSRYTHADHTRVMRDVRKKRLTGISWDQVYYVGFRISACYKVCYRHALILADSYDEFLEGVAGEFNTILDQSPGTSLKDIALVFVRNLMILDPELAAAAESQHITTDIRDELSKRDDDHYLVFGRVGEERICLVKVQAGDALLGIEYAQRSVRAKYQKEMLPLEVCQIHPVTAECYALFDVAAERIKSLISGESTNSVYLH